MNKQRFEISNLNKMIDRIDQIKQLYKELSEETREQLDNSFEWENKPLAVINHLEIVLNDCLEIIKEVKKCQQLEQK